MPEPEPEEVYKLDIETMRRHLLRKAFLFDDPRTYEAGIEDALREVSHLLEERNSSHR